MAMVLEFQPGETEKNITVDIVGDRRTERNETFELYLTAGLGVQLSPISRAEVTIEDDDGIHYHIIIIHYYTLGCITGTITLNPSFGSVLGGTAVLVSGSQLTFNKNRRISCVFDDVEVTGVYVNEQQALCVSPNLTETGRVLFQISYQNSAGGSVTGESTFTSCKIV